MKSTTNWPPSPPSVPPQPVKSAGLNGWVKALMVGSMLSLLSSPLALAEIQPPLPCHSSQPACLTQLTQAATQNSLELTTIDQRLAATQTRIDQQRRGKWKTWVQSSPIGIVANILGGGDAQRVDLAIADLEVKADELRRRRAAVTVQIREQVLSLLQTIERYDRQLADMQATQAANAQRLAVIEVGYKFGRGSTADMMRLWQAAETEKARIREVSFDRGQTIRKLAGLTGYEFYGEIFPDAASYKH